MPTWLPPACFCGVSSNQSYLAKGFFDQPLPNAADAGSWNKYHYVDALDSGDQGGVQGSEAGRSRSDTADVGKLPCKTKRSDETASKSTMSLLSLCVPETMDK